MEKGSALWKRDPREIHSRSGCRTPQPHIQVTHTECRLAQMQSEAQNKSSTVTKEFNNNDYIRAWKLHNKTYNLHKKGCILISK